MSLNSFKLQNHMIDGDPNLNTQELHPETSPHWAHTGSSNCLLIGTRLAEFEVTGVIGEGGFGNVYLAFDHSLQRTVAIKEYMPVALASRGADDEVLVQTKRHRKTFETGMNSFINEARLLAQFDHPALIKVYRFWEQNRTAYMAMRYYEGQTFKNIIEKNSEVVTEAWLKPILRPLLKALETLYKIQILHRDISPDNIMIQPNGDAVLLDFGAARQIIGDMSQALTVILKPGYAPVEQYADDSEMKQGPWTDIYALSAVVYSAIVKSPPPTSVTRLLKDPIKLLQNSDRPGFSKQFLAAIDKGMAVKPEDRPQTIEEFSALLEINNIPAAQVIPLPSEKTGRIKKKNQADVAEQNDANGMRAKSPSRKKAKSNEAESGLSNKGSWALLIAGVLLAVAMGVYRFSHPSNTPQVSANPSASANGQVADTHAQPPAATSIAPVDTALLKTERSLAASNNIDTASAQVSTNASTSASLVSPSSSMPPSSVPQANSADAVAKSTAATADATTNQPASTASTSSTSHDSAATPTIAATELPTKTETTKTPEATPKITASFHLSVRPWAEVFVDGSEKGVSPPMKNLVLPEGKHQIRLVNPNFPSHSVEVTVNSKKHFGAIDYEFKAN